MGRDSLLPNTHLVILLGRFPHSYTLVCVTYAVETASLNSSYESRPEHELSI